jgi:hypothetical protein
VAKRDRRDDSLYSISSKTCDVTHLSARNRFRSPNHSNRT